jgi:hypothetical protein
MLTLTQIQTLYPKPGCNQALTGRIPMDWFCHYEADIRQAMRGNNVKTIYRGARLSNKLSRPHMDKPTMTRRCDATHVVLYRK